MGGQLPDAIVCKTTGSTSAAMLRSCEKVVRRALYHIGLPGPRCFVLRAWARRVAVVVQHPRDLVTLAAPGRGAEHAARTDS